MAGLCKACAPREGNVDGPLCQGPEPEGQRPWRVLQCGRHPLQEFWVRRAYHRKPAEFKDMTSGSWLCLKAGGLNLLALGKPTCRHAGRQEIEKGGVKLT